MLTHESKWHVSSSKHPTNSVVYSWAFSSFLMYLLLCHSSPIHLFHQSVSPSCSPCLPPFCIFNWPFFFIIQDWFFVGHQFSSTVVSSPSLCTLLLGPSPLWCSSWPLRVPHRIHHNHFNLHDCGWLLPYLFLIDPREMEVLWGWKSHAMSFSINERGRNKISWRLGVYL